MGKQSILPPRLQHASTRIALLLLLVLHLAALSQTSTTSALTVPLILPSAIVFDTSGNLYIAETANHVILKVDTTGHITTIAGTGTQGFSGDNAPATSASLDSPQGLALDSANNLYIADTHNHRIRKINLASNIITTIAGTGVAGFSGDNTSATAAQLNLPTALAIDTSNNLYLADTGNHRIREINFTSGLITTIAGNGTQTFSGDNGLATSAAIDSPTGLTIASNNLYLADTHNHRIRKINLTSNTITTIAGTGIAGFSGDNASATTANVALPHGLAIDNSGNLYLADTENHRIRRIDATTGLITTVAGNGTQTYSGDNAHAIAASLDTPRAVTLPPSALLTIADTGNQRIRQLDTAPAPSTDIHTIAGLGVTIPGALTLTAPSVIAYGTGQVTASLTTSSPATGNIVFLNAANSLSATLATIPLASNQAIFSTANLPVSVYSLTAAYDGDQTHLSAQSPTITFNIAPQTLTAAITSVTTLLYGQPIPSLTGTLTGILPQDTGNITVSFTTTAAALSPSGVYPITAFLSGPAAGNYNLAATPSTITINPASTSTILSNLIATATTGSAVTLTTQVVSNTAVTPTGTITLLDGATQLAAIALSNGDATFSNLTLSSGTHTLTALYSGTSNFLSSTSNPQQITINSGSSTPPSTADFTLAATGTTSQSILSGSSANFTFIVQPQGSMSSPVTLAATGLPNLATASFNPPTIPPGATSSAFTLTIATPETVARNYISPPAWALLFLPLLGLTLRHRTLSAKLLTVAILGIALLSATGCGDRINAAASSVSTSSKSYTITVTGTATTSTGGTLQHSTNVTLILQPPS